MPKYWFGTDYNMNLYLGCPHSCIYCDSRSEKYGISDFDRANPKADAVNIIRQELQAKRKTGVIATGAMSDPYNPLEKELSLTRSALSLIEQNGFGVAICTKSDLVTRDIDLLCRIKAHSPVIVKMTVTTANDDLCKKIEPNVCSSSKRFEALAKLSQNGIFCGVLMMPLLPFLEDNEENVLQILKKAADAGATFVYPSFSVTMRQNQRDYFYEKLDLLFPGLKQKYQAAFKDDYVCMSPKADALSKLFTKECEKRGLYYQMPDIIRGYQEKYNTQTSFL